MTLFDTTATEELRALLALRFTPQLGPRRIEALRQHFGSAGAALMAGPSGARHVDSVDARGAAGLGDAATLRRADEEIERARKVGAQLLGRGLPGYPAALEALPDPPPVLWVRGTLPDLAVVPTAIGVVGTRACSAHARSFTRALAADLARAGVVVVSGLARGIDTAAHTAAVDAGGASIGVLGSGVDTIYPAENKALAARLCVVSEYPLGTRPAAHNFPARNRVIAALSAGSVVVEGEARSGAMITAVAALECGRTVFAVPGRAGDPLAAGPHQLLRDGAVLVEGAADILREFGWADAPSRAPLDLPDDQARVLAALTGPRTLDDVLSVSGVADAHTALLMLQLAGLVEESGGRYARR
ncbi:DNA-processing protein DprA [Deinococcus maricopensis]|uniref:DNA protecting protein DprA n=1 Tax=Deinococcus maricopensis (strain DSM 21211 / LMG 22137 / NRRL B-23946 / LB-34) TaxID=709986 RepID=E8UC60_DEIML|nr:DNA-processing protein DprA [Deinococcus maricopensis]ADV68721.1 DNA protecting protein DprA [Deinococcus maricopensis DSM 21211]